MDPDEVLKTGFHRGLQGLQIVEQEAGSSARLCARLEVGSQLTNVFGTLHGGAIATLVDDLATFAIARADRYGRAGTTTDLHVSYLAPAALGDTLWLEAQVTQSGLSLAFAEVSLSHLNKKRFVARGRMTKLLGDRPVRR